MTPERPSPPATGTEAETLLGFLDFQRATFAWKCAGLDDAQLRTALPTSDLTLAGLLKHLACAEDVWIGEVVGGLQPVPPWRGRDRVERWDWSLSSARDDDGDALRALWADRSGRARALVAARLEADPDALSATHSALPVWGQPEQVSLRWVLGHLLEEYARHNGHADLLREALDGQTGE